MIIIKVGGGEKINWDYICEDTASLKEEVILVHGGNWETKKITEQLGKKVRLIISPSGYTSRYTDRETLEILTMVYSGLINKRVVLKLQKYGLNAVGLSGIDGRIWEGERKKVVLERIDNKVKAIRDNFQGKVTKVNSKLIKLLVINKYLPVITIPAISKENEMINIDNDRAIAVIAKEMGIKKIVVLFEARGLMKNINDSKSIIKKIDINKIEDYYKFAKGNMKKKLLGAKEAFDLGVNEIYWADGRIKNPITKALKGEGTIITRD